MIQIKTIRRADPEDFDRDVNEAIAEGWTLDKRYLSDVGFVAELEREVITEAEVERRCGNCAHFSLIHLNDACRYCGDNYNKWEAKT
jgi:hypothetical protein